MATYDLTSTTPTKLVAGDIINCPYSGSVKSLTLPKGIYKLEVWGAQGGSYSSYYGGAGGYSVGTLNLESKLNVYLYAGGQPATNTTSGSTNVSSGGFNGGGSSKVHYYSSTYSYSQGGGGGSDIRIGTDSLYARVIVAGGGGGSSSTNLLTYAYGGGESGGSYTSGYEATQTTPGTNGSFGQGANHTGYNNYKYGSGGGGGGWYGGGTENSVSDSSSSYRRYCGGGSGYVYTSETVSNYPDGCLLDSTMYLTDASTIAGNTSFTSPDGVSETGHTGNGYVRITVIKVRSANLPVNIDGNWKESESVHVNVDGTWKEVESIFVNIDGTWKEVGA